MASSQFVRLMVALCAACCVIGGDSVAQTEDWPEVVVIKGRKAVAPAMWRAQKGEAQITILGVLPVFPKAQAWNTKRVENALRGANVLVTPATSEFGAGDVASFVMRKGLSGGQTLSSALPPALYQRYEATARRVQISTRDFQHDKPVWAGVRLRREVLQKVRLTDDEPVATVRRLAGRAGVPVRAAARYDMGKIIKDVNGMDKAASEACLVYTLNDIDFDLGRAPKVGAAWAVGDLGTVRDLYQGGALANCLSGSGKGANLVQRSITDTLVAIDKAARKPGKSVVIVPMAALLRRGGVLEQLRARGYEISSPD